MSENLRTETKGEVAAVKFTQAEVDAYNRRQGFEQVKPGVVTVSNCCGGSISPTMNPGTNSWICGECGKACDIAVKEEFDKSNACEDESELHADILAECRRRGWLAIHSRMDAKTTTAVGTPDFIIFFCKPSNMFGGQMMGERGVLLVEAKSKKNKPSVAQNAWHAHASKLGYEVSIVRSFAEFLALL